MNRQRVLSRVQYQELCKGKSEAFLRDLDAIARQLGERVLIDEAQFWDVTGRHFLLPDRPVASCC